MSFAQNLSYSIVQVVHNVGAVLVIGGSFGAVFTKNLEAQKKWAWITLMSWGLQALSGTFFGVISFYFYHSLPDIAGIAFYAILIKIICTVLGFIVVAIWGKKDRPEVFVVSGILGMIALTGAAFLRWFS